MKYNTVTKLDIFFQGFLDFSFFFSCLRLKKKIGFCIRAYHVFQHRLFGTSCVQYDKIGQFQKNRDCNKYLDNLLVDNHKQIHLIHLNVNGNDTILSKKFNQCFPSLWVKKEELKIYSFLIKEAKRLYRVKVQNNTICCIAKLSSSWLVQCQLN